MHTPNGTLASAPVQKTLPACSHAGAPCIRRSARTNAGVGQYNGWRVLKKVHNPMQKNVLDFAGS
jgi:hypothetical protein